ncbi:MAG: UDP-N-acetylmuramoyl-tripeptide--D-alanyl-D-alanine ligase [Muribaculaceae bacterium]|nr:UDP-N-acetylmuramoyl-tripeptide--D-alanyl-D-alanine ligase [Muribaculaceae bacterium]
MNIILITVYVIAGIYMVMNFKHDLQMLQQNSYRLKRYWKWQSGNLMDTWRLIDVALLLLLFSRLLHNMLSVIIVGLVLAFKTIIILRKKYKKPLVFTPRIWRLYSITAILGIATFCTVLFSCADKSEVLGFYSPVIITLGTILLITIFSWLFIIVALLLLKPVEELINRHYRNDAIRILRSMPELKIIGITGSYGKTSTKHYLQRILSESYDVLITPGSYNTPLGVIRTIREMMKPYNEVFICEMGAKQNGDIKEICDLVHPSIGIVTSVGPMHLETFGSLENVQATKFELIDALPTEGLGVVNNDFPLCASRQVTNVKVLRYTVKGKPDCQYQAYNIKYNHNGTTFTLKGPDNLSLQLQTQLIGEGNIANLLGAIIIALYLNVSPEKIKYAVSQIKQVEHRLNVKRTPSGVTIIDDAFNSNPTGARMAVDVLKSFTDGKRIIVTPGMIELGSEQYNLNRELGEYISGKVDIAIVVGKYNRDAIVEGLKKRNIEDTQIIIVDTFNQAQEKLQSLLSPSDTVLYENDLPDTFK